MPYESTSDLPENITNVLPKHAQEIFMKAYNSAYKEYDKPSERRGDATREETARRVAWAAVKKTYKKGDDDKWHKK